MKLFLSILLLTGFSGACQAEVVDIAGIIQCNSVTRAWYILDNSDHMPLHLNSVSVTTTKINVGWDFTADKVISLTISPDEVYAPMGVIGGASVGFSTAYFKFNQPINTLCLPGSNFFVNGKMWVND